MSTRTVLSFGRDLEFASPTELSKRMGCPRHYWVRAAVKELTDNSLDACEETGIAPEVTIVIEGSAISVADNGPGMTRELVDKVVRPVAADLDQGSFREPRSR
jgi:sensor histidine kinase regulating citrate/malate metabolism